MSKLSTTLIQDYRYLKERNYFMQLLNWILLFLLIALAAGAFGLGGIEGTALTAARILAFIFLVLFIASMVL
jgi:uncharacterized membrane protein YtjA (UPF0391 family)